MADTTQTAPPRDDDGLPATRVRNPSTETVAPQNGGAPDAHPRNPGTADTTVTAKASPAPPGAIPVTVPGYEILGVLGRGGMGVVYKARQTAADRIVALKMILSGAVPGGGERERFRTEAEAIARLQHPNVVQLFEVGEYTGQQYFSLEFCPNGSLDKRLRGDPLPPRPAAELVVQIARGVAAAHEQGVIHRDLKPANVLLSEDGTPKITDFGLAKKLDEQGGHTRTHAVMGTPSYMSPEQAVGHTPDVGPLTDVYALGAILYDAVTGRPPFKGSAALDTLEQVKYQEPVPPRQLNPSIPRDLETICLRCLQKQQNRRYATAGELADDLGRFLTGRPITARPVGGAERAWKWCRRNPVVAVLIAAAAAAFVGIAVALVAIRGKNDELVRANGDLDTQRGRLADTNSQLKGRQEELATVNASLDRTNLSLKKAVDEEKAASRAARHQSYNLGMFVAGREWLNLNTAAMQEQLDRAPPEFRGWEWHYLSRQATAGVERVIRYPDAGRVAPGHVTQVDFTPDQNFLTVCGQSRNDLSLFRAFVAAYDARSGERVRWWQLPPDDQVRTSFCYCANREGTRAAVMLGLKGPPARTVWQIWDVEAGLVADTLPKEFLHALSFTQDGKRVWGLDNYQRGGKLLEYDIGARRIVQSIPLDGRYGRLTLDPFGPRAAVWYPDEPSIAVYDLDSGKELWRVKRDPAVTEPDNFRGTAFAPQGTLLISLDRLREYDAATGRLIRVLPAKPARAISVDPRGEFLTLTSERQNGSRVVNYRTGEVAFEHPVADYNSGVASPISRDGRQVVRAGQGIMILNLNRDPQRRSVPFPRDRPAASDDEMRFFVQPEFVRENDPVPKSMRFFDAGGAPAGELPVTSAFYPHPVFGPGGTYVLNEILTGEPKLAHRVRAYRLGGPNPMLLGEHVFRGGEEGARGVAADASGRVAILTTTKESDRSRARVLLWDAAGGGEPVLLGERFVQNGLGAVAKFSPDEKFLALITEMAVEKESALDVFETATRARRFTMPVGWLTPHIQFAPDSSRVFVAKSLPGGFVTCESLKLPTFERERFWEGQLPARPVFSANGRFVAGHSAIPNAGSSLVVWDAATGRQLWRTPGGHDSIAFLDNDRRVAAVRAAPGDKWQHQTVLFDASTGQELLTLPGGLANGGARAEPDGRFRMYGFTSNGKPGGTAWELWTWDGSPVPGKP